MIDKEFEKSEKYNERYSFVRGVFDSVYSKYDLMNDLMSFGMHRFWKKKMINILDPKQNTSTIDMAGGTADIASLIASRDCGKVTVCDASYQMMQKGKYKLIDKNMMHNLDWVCCVAESLPFCDNSFDYYTVSFGMRNFSDIELSLREALRVLKPGGKFVCLEFSHVEALKNLYSIYLNSFIPKIGEVVTGNRGAYEYLADSIENFYTQEDFMHIIENAGFKSVCFRNSSCGIVAFHVAFKES